ncbi:hypothetical protein G6F66_013654 [Rhizopus arrhizus]|nr:hypothetical protein G6F66_013654 [Rhizopus arrhizus]
MNLYDSAGCNNDGASQQPSFSSQTPLLTTPNTSPTTTTTNSSYNTTTNSAPRLTFGTLNCRGLVKTANTSVRNHFIRYLRSQPLDVLALQATHAKTPELQNLFHTQFEANDSLWSPHCGLVSFSKHISFGNSSISACGRVITTTITHTSHLFAPVTVTVLYAPANATARRSFLMHLLMKPHRLLPADPSRHIVLGDFNYSYSSVSHSIRAPTSWLQYSGSKN